MSIHIHLGYLRVLYNQTGFQDHPQLVMSFTQHHLPHYLRASAETSMSAKQRRLSEDVLQVMGMITIGTGTSMVVSDRENYVAKNFTQENHTNQHVHLIVIDHSPKAKFLMKKKPFDTTEPHGINIKEHVSFPNSIRCNKIMCRRGGVVCRDKGSLSLHPE
ncbi:hypothetical protein ElyMa_004031200 [Elysia marginata]|uniref:Uncharacterized protein n=1 Tax=Elysia marginata TaxID=1093978 RepID=A0AAV4G4F3_9GAST|nr:hypothetical protein ElyMa_004031200 [Elysia marginata]